MSDDDQVGAHPRADRAFAATPSSPSVSPVPASIPCASAPHSSGCNETENCSHPAENNDVGATLDPVKFLQELERSIAKSARQEQSNFIAPIFSGVLQIVASAAREATTPRSAIAIEARSGETERLDPQGKSAAIAQGVTR